MSEWYKSTGRDGDIAVSTRIRIARNLSGIPFPARLSESGVETVNRAVRAAAAEIDESICGALTVIDMNKVSKDETCAMVERHVISPDFAENCKNRLLVISPDESVSIMVCEEDHIRIQVIKAGLALEEAYALADAIDDSLAKHLNFAFDDRFGYLTQCPTNLGTGLRASVMLHLPVIEENGALAVISDSAAKFGLTVRGLYGEGTKASASLYQISNQITLGISERGALENLKSIALQIIKKERSDRESLNRIVLEDEVMRAYGLLKNQRILSSKELMELISRVKLGVSTGIIKLENDALPVRLLVECQPYMLQKLNGVMSPDDRDICRGKIVRERMETV